MYWGHYAGAFFAGVFLVNTVPHFVKGICGDPFPTPFAKPPGKGLSSAPVNTAWALLNLAVGVGLWRISQPFSSHGLFATFTVAVVFFAMQMSVHFQTKEKE